MFVIAVKAEKNGINIIVAIKYEFYDTRYFIKIL
jgi:hypothetical protein